MQVIVEIPENELLPPDRARQALEAFAIAGYRSGAISPLETRLMLGLTRMELDGFLKQDEVWEGAYTIEDLRSDMAGAQS